MLEMDVFIGMDKNHEESHSDPAIENSEKNIQVLPNVGAAHSGEDILWRVHSLDDRVKRVEITFKQATDEFFPKNTTTDIPLHTCPIVLRQHPGGTNKGYGSILGRVPQGGSQGVSTKKYSILAYGANSKLYDVDPLIVTVDP